MERIKHSIEQPMDVEYATNDEPIVLSKALLDLLLEQENPSELISLYTFYYYTAKWQRTDKPKVTTHYTMKGLGIGYDRLHRAQQVLVTLGLIEKFSRKGNDGKITGWYIRVNFIWRRDSLSKKFVLDEPKELETSAIPKNVNGNKNQFGVSPVLGKTRTGFQDTNALSSNNSNALSSNSKNIIVPPQKNEQYFPIAKRLSEIILTNKNIKHTTQQLKTWTKDIRQLVETNGVKEQRIHLALDWYADNIGGEYVPVIESGSSLKLKFEKLEAAVERSKINGHSFKNKSSNRISNPGKIKYVLSDE
jgi:hypothetical protein